MQVYTSNYFKYKGERGVQISNSKPKDINVSGVLPALFPDWNEVERWNRVKDNADNQEDWSRFVIKYWDKLDILGIDKMRNLLHDGDVLLCWCNRDTCHRFVLSTWLNLHGIEVKEW